MGDLFFALFEVEVFIRWAVLVMALRADFFGLRDEPYRFPFDLAGEDGFHRLLLVVVASGAMTRFTANPIFDRVSLTQILFGDAVCGDVTRQAFVGRLRVLDTLLFRDFQRLL